jgi:hypothetical protein
MAALSIIQIGNQARVMSMVATVLNRTSTELNCGKSCHAQPAQSVAGVLR